MKTSKCLLLDGRVYGLVTTRVAQNSTDVQKISLVRPPKYIKVKGQVYELKEDKTNELVDWKFAVKGIATELYKKISEEVDSVQTMSGAVTDLNWVLKAPEWITETDRSKKYIKGTYFIVGTPEKSTSIHKRIAARLIDIVGTILKSIVKTDQDIDARSYSYGDKRRNWNLGHGIEVGLDAGGASIVITVELAREP